MAPESAGWKTNALIIAGAMALVLAFLLGLAVCYAIFVEKTPTVASVSPPPVRNPNFAIKAQLPDDMRETAQEASDHFKNNEYEAAAGCYQRIIDKYPDCLYAWGNLGVVRYQQGDYDEAKTALLQAIQLSPDDAFSCSNLGITYYQLNQYDEATRCLEKAVALDPNDSKSHNYLGCCYSQKGQQAKAEEEFKKAIELNPKFGDAYFNLSLVYATVKPPDIEQAKTNYQQALDLGIAKDPRMEKLISKGAAAK